MTPIFFIDMLDNFFAPTVLKIDVYIRRLLAFGREKPLKEKLCVIGADLGYAKTIANCRVSGRTTPLTIDIFTVCETDNLMHRQEKMFVS